MLDIKDRSQEPGLTDSCVTEETRIKTIEGRTNISISPRTLAALLAAPALEFKMNCRGVKIVGKVTLLHLMQMFFGSNVSD